MLAARNARASAICRSLDSADSGSGGSEVVDAAWRGCEEEDDGTDGEVCDCEDMVGECDEGASDCVRMGVGKTDNCAGGVELDMITAELSGQPCRSE